MDQSTINKLGTATKVFGAVLFVVLAAAMAWSLTQPPVTNGPMPDPWPQQQSK
jgi:hypothetical protein